MRAIYGLRTYTAFDWISGQYQKGTLTLQGFVRTPQLKAQAEQAARKIREIEVVDNRIEVLPTHQGDDDIRLNAYIAIYGSSALERYAPGGQLSGAQSANCGTLRGLVSMAPTSHAVLTPFTSLSTARASCCSVK